MRFMVESRFTAAPTLEVLALIPAEQARVVSLMGAESDNILPVDLSDDYRGTIPG
jgi:hypothetical protein